MVDGVPEEDQVHVLGGLAVEDRQVIVEFLVQTVHLVDLLVFLVGVGVVSEE